MQQQLNPFTLPIDPMGMWRLGLFVGTFTCMLILLRWYRKEIGWEAVGLWAWVISSCLYIVEFPLVPYGSLNVIFQAAAGQTLAEAMLYPMAILAAPRVTWRVVNAYMWITLGVTWAGGSLLTGEFTGRFWEHFSPSFDTALLALYLPFAGRSLQFASLLTIAFTHGSAALTIVLAQVIALALSDLRARWALLMVAPAAVALAYAHSNSAWFDSSTRLHYWSEYLSLWAYGPPLYGPPSPSWWTGLFWSWIIPGMGPGSFIWFYGMTHNWNDSPPALHMEIFQIAGELGLIGLALAAAFYGRALRNAWADLRLRAALFGILAMSLTWYPLRTFAPAFVIGLILREAIKNRPSLFKLGR